MQIIVFDYFNNYNIVSDANPSSSLYSFISEDNNMDVPDTNAHMTILY